MLSFNAVLSQSRATQRQKNPQLCWYLLRSQMSNQVLFPYLHIPPVLRKRPKNVLKTSQSDSYISRNFPIFPDVNCISDIAEPKKVKNLIYHGPKSLDQNQTIRGRPQDAVCWDDGTYGWFTDSTPDIFIDAICIFFIDKCYIWKRSHRSMKGTRTWNSSVICITFNYESFGKRSHESWNRIKACVDFIGITFIE